MKTITLGILGGGQLGRMSAMAAARLGIKTVIFTPETDSPASHVAFKTIVANYDDETALRAFAESVNVISYEFENIPVKTVQYIKTLKPVYPDEMLLEIAQDRVSEKSYLNSIGIPTARWHAPTAPQEVLDTLDTWQATHCILKTRRFGYDGKGQTRYSRDMNIDTVLSQFQNTPLIMEEIVDFTGELSVIIARDHTGHSETYGPVWNEHKDHILSRSLVPAPISDTTAQNALALAQTLAGAVNLRGILTLELFLLPDGGLLANEIAPRTHNSGHWSIDACTVSQFENHIRAVCGLPIALPARHSNAEMINLIGDDIKNIENYIDKNGAAVHLYGKSEPRPGRKMGHVTFLKR